MTDDNQPDVQALPLAEFDLRAGLRHVDGVEGLVVFERAASMPCKITVNEDGTWHAVSMDEEDIALATAAAALGS